MRDIFSSGIPCCLKTKSFGQCVLLMWSLTTGLIRRLEVTQKTKAKSILGDFLRNEITNVEIHR